MVWPPERLDASPAVTIHPDYELRTFRHDSADDLNGWYRLMELAGFGVWDEARLAPILARILPNGWFFAVHRETGRLAASAMACHEPRPLHPFGGALNWVCGDPARRGKGLGMSVCAAVTARLLAAGYENIFLLTDDFRLPALSIYLKLGYRPLLHAPDMEERWQSVYEQLGGSIPKREYRNLEIKMKAQIFADYLERLEALQHNLHKEVGDLSAEGMDWSPGSKMNSVAVLLAHITGLLQEGIDLALDNPPSRMRAQEFQTRGVLGAEMVRHLDAVVNYARSALPNLRLEDLDKERKDEDGMVTCGWALLHALEHAYLHLGHIQITGQMWRQRER